MDKWLVRKRRFRVGLERKENYDLVVGKVVSYVKEPAEEDTIVDIIFDFEVLLDFSVESPYGLAPRENNKLYVMMAVDNRISDDLRRLYSEKLKEVDTSLFKSSELLSFEVQVSYLNFYYDKCEVGIWVRSGIKTIVPTRKLYRVFSASTKNLEVKFTPLMEASKEYIVRSMTENDWFEEILTEKFPVYEKGTKVTLREDSVKTNVLNFIRNFVVKDRPYSFSYVYFKIPVSKDMGNLLMGMSEYELITVLTFYLSVIKEGPCEFEGEKVPLEIEIHYPPGSLTFDGSWKELYHSLMNYRNYGLEE